MKKFFKKGDFIPDFLVKQYAMFDDFKKCDITFDSDVFIETLDCNDDFFKRHKSHQVFKIQPISRIDNEHCISVKNGKNMNIVFLFPNGNDGFLYFPKTTYIEDLKDSNYLKYLFLKLLKRI